MTHYKESGQRDAELFERLNRSWIFARDMSQRAADERAALWRRLNDLQRQFMNDLVPEVRQIGELQIYILVELRRELDVGGDTHVFQQTMRKQIERAEKAVEEFDRSVYAVEPQ
jgi:hypothetical protein